VIFPQLHGFVRGRCKDMPALIAGLSLPYSNGPAEGVNTKVEGSCSADRHHRFCASAELMTSLSVRHEPGLMQCPGMITAVNGLIP